MAMYMIIYVHIWPCIYGHFFLPLQQTFENIRYFDSIWALPEHSYGPPIWTKFVTKMVQKVTPWQYAQKSSSQTVV